MKHLFIALGLSVSFSMNTEALEKKSFFGECTEWFTRLSKTSSTENIIPAGPNVIDTFSPEDIMCKIFHSVHKGGEDLQAYRTITRVCHRWHNIVRKSIYQLDLGRVFQYSPFLPTALMAVLLADNRIPNCSKITKLTFSMNGHTQKDSPSLLAPQDVIRRLEAPFDRLLDGVYEVGSTDWWALRWQNDIKENLRQIKTTTQQAQKKEIGMFRTIASYAYNTIDGFIDLKLLRTLQGDSREIRNNPEWTATIGKFLSTFTGLQTLILTVNHSVNLSMLSGLPHLSELHIGSSRWGKPDLYTCSWPNTPQLGVKTLRIKNKFWPEDIEFFTSFPNLTTLHLHLNPPVNDDEKGKIIGLALDLCALHSPYIEALSLKGRIHKQIDIVSPIAKWSHLKKLLFKDIILERPELEAILQSPSLISLHMKNKADFKKLCHLNAANPALGTAGINLCVAYTDEELATLREQYPNVSIITEESEGSEDEDF